MKSHHWTMPVYNAVVWFYDDREFMKKELAKISHDDMPDLGAYDGLMQYLTSPNNGSVYLVGVFNKQSPTLAHECIHLAIDVLERHGVKTTGENDEPLTYLVETCMREFMRRHKIK